MGVTYSFLRQAVLVRFKPHYEYLDDELQGVAIRDSLMTCAVTHRLRSLILNPNYLESEAVQGDREVRLRRERIFERFVFLLSERA